MRLLVTLVMLFLFTPQLVQAQPSSTLALGYTERLDLFVAGSNVLWKVQFSGANATLSGLADVEAQMPDVSEYSIFVANGSSWIVDYEILSKSAFNQLLGDPIPVNGIFLKVKASTPASASNFASILNPVLLSAFVEYSSSEAEYLFYSHTDFKSLVRDHLWAAVPTQLKGMANLVDSNLFLSGKLPMILLEGRRSGNTISHTLTISGVIPTTFTDKNFYLQDVLPTISRTSASRFSTSTSVAVRFVGSLISSSSGAEVVNMYENLTSILTASIPAGQPLPKINATIESGFPSLVAVREVDKGVVNLGETVEVRLKLQNLAPSGSPAIENVTVREEWWTPYFERVAGNSSLFIPKLNAGESKDLVYVIRAMEAQPTEVTQSPNQNQIYYSYKVGSRVLTAKTSINQLQLSLNQPRPAISVVASTATTAPSVNGASLTLNVNNFGSRTAFNVEAYIDGRLVGRNGSLLPGAKWNIISKIPSSSLKETQKTLTQYAKWVEEGSSKETNANSINVHYRLSTPQIATLDLLKKVTTISQGDKTNLNVSIAVSNTGALDAYMIRLEERLPNGLTYVKGGFAAETKGLTATIQQIKAGTSQSLQYLAEVKMTDENYVIPPTSASMQLDSGIIQRISNSHILPMGVKVEKSLTPTTGFPGAKVNVAVNAVNEGQLPIYNLTLNAGSDPFLTVTQGNTSSTAKALIRGERLAFKYAATLMPAGTYQASEASLTFTFSGIQQTTQSTKPPLAIYEPVRADLSINPPNPLEEETFDLALKIINPSKVSVSDVQVEIAIPSSINILKTWAPGNLSVLTVGELKANESRVFTAQAKLPGSLDLFINPPNVTFTYGGENLQGQSNPLTIHSYDDVYRRYGLPTGLAVVIGLATIVLLRRATFKVSEDKTP